MSREGHHLFTSESVTEGHPDKIADRDHWPGYDSRRDYYIVFCRFPNCRS